MAWGAVPADELPDGDVPMASKRQSKAGGAGGRRQQLRQRLQDASSHAHTQTLKSSSVKLNEAEEAARRADELPTELGGGAIPALFWKPLEGIFTDAGADTWKSAEELLDGVWPLGQGILPDGDNDSMPGITGPPAAPPLQLQAEELHPGQKEPGSQPTEAESEPEPTSPKPDPASPSAALPPRSGKRPLLKKQAPPSKPMAEKPTDASTSYNQGASSLWSQSKQAVERQRQAQQEAADAPSGERVSFTFAPAVALRLVPNYEAQIYNWPPSEPEPPASKPRQRGLIRSSHGSRDKEKAMVDANAAEAVTYQQVLQYAEEHEPVQVPVAPIQMDYHQIVNYRCGPAALEPFAAVPMQQFEKNMLSMCSDYRDMAQFVKPPPEKPQYDEMIRPFELEADGAGRCSEAAHREKLLQTFKENKQVCEKLIKESLKMGSAMPPLREDMTSNRTRIDKVDTEKYAGKVPREAESPPKSDKRFHKIRLDILILRAINLPEAIGLAESRADPYCVVTVVDGDPLSEEAIAGGEEWYQKHEQYHGQTGTLDDELNPEWRHRLTAEVRPRKDSYVHFRIYDHDPVMAIDRGVGQAAVRLSDVQMDLYHGPRPIALEPCNKSNAREWGGLRHSRLFFSIGWEGAAARLRKRTDGQQEPLPAMASRTRKRG